ncbi:MAG: hypothetical protein ACOYXY_23540 [Thermodesulfobacteriota bacterium]
MNKDSTLLDREPLEVLPSGKYELVTVFFRRSDLVKLHKLGGPRADQIAMAMWHYLREKERSNWEPPPRAQREVLIDVTSLNCAVPKELAVRIRSLGGLWHLHTMEALRLFLT